MLGFVFGLNARLGRLHFFLATVALAIVMTAICFAIAMAMLRTTSPSMVRPEDLTRNWAIIGAIVCFGLATFMLQSMRIRDIGWDPVCVIPAWIALMIVDHVVAGRFPAWAIGGEHQGTMVGGLVNLGLLLALTFWPSAGSGAVYINPFEPPARAAGKPSASDQRLARVSQGSARPGWS
ncbi:hypothetical protein [Bradyrhizobium guangzhouense]|uniref:DUF805 domain-containing protein n=1 Tax=Bradyrhizobium guangzhouense TaxID=1325095 RepID=A0AAE6C956_9BRAD|nr:hypothetical protein [Bradyrhizobium guangzhouense]QAU47170.1 hypothetical protein XH91_18630 [Bradyrhizobium guangzhouense]RXH09539.1 hypothetical protein EAS54_33670 [Bradyrhizobium guangzhouense]RXH13763.1 hypothetical protein EAS56_14345 [Bradyrhizobium guangzhouense]